MEEFLLPWISHYGYIGIFFLLMLPLASEALLAFSGYPIFRGELGEVPTVVLAFLGSICGITFFYWIGRREGSYLIRRYGDKVGITPARIERACQWMDHPVDKSERCFRGE